jgi:nucleoside triphosphate pyrophosphatase
MELILASASARRAEILRNAGFPFKVCPANVDEARLPNEPAEDYVLRVAIEKGRIAAETVAEAQNPAIIIAADTAVALGAHVFGKPASLESARSMLRTLSGQTHQVLTGLCLLTRPENREVSQVEITKVTFAELREPEIETYLVSGEPFDKAGAYGIQGIGGRYVTGIEGCYFNVMGLPLSRLWSALRSLGWTDANRS